MLNDTRNVGRSASPCRGTLIAALMIIAVACFSGASFAQGQGKGGGKGGGGGGGEDPAPPPSAPAADPAIVFAIESAHLAVMNEDGSHITTIFSESVHARWSPDIDGDPGNGYQGTLAIIQGTTLWLGEVRVVDGTPALLNVRQVADDSASHFDWSPDLNPDTDGYQGILLYVERPVPLGGPRDIRGIAVSWDPATDSTIDTPLDHSLYKAPGAISQARWMADGARIVFKQDSGVYIIDDLDHPEPRFLMFNTKGISEQTSNLAPSRTGTLLAYNFYFEGSIWPHIWTIDVDAPETTQTHLGLEGGWVPQWAPDDSALVFHAHSGPPDKTHKIYRYDFATNTVTLLAGEKKVGYTRPHWRPFP